MKKLKVFKIPQDLHQKPELVEIDDTLAAKQALVGGYIECVSFPRMGFCMWDNEDGLIRQMEVNVRASVLWNKEFPHDMSVIRGSVYLTGFADKNGRTQDFPELLLDTVTNLVVNLPPAPDETKWVKGTYNGKYHWFDGTDRWVLVHEQLSVCDNCGEIDHTPEALRVCVDSMVGHPACLICDDPSHATEDCPNGDGTDSDECGICGEKFKATDERAEMVDPEDELHVHKIVHAQCGLSRDWTLA